MIAACLHEDEVIKAFADDTAVVIKDYTRTLPTLCMLFTEYEQISGLALNVNKTVFIPLWQFSVSSLRNLVHENCLLWKNICTAAAGKYLGFFIGPGAGKDSWNKPLRKYVKRAEMWTSLHLGMYFNARVYQMFIATVLGFVKQLEACPEDLDEYHRKALRLLAPGLGTWATPADLANLQKAYHLPFSFADPQWTALAAKLRVVETIAPDCHDRVRELENVHANQFQRPFKMWHYRSYFATLANAENECKMKGITRIRVRSMVKTTSKLGFQKVAEDAIGRAFAAPYYAESMLRTKLVRWKLLGVPAIMENRIFANLAMLGQWCAPRVQVAFFRSLWNGWTTDRRMNSLVLQNRGCVLGCGWDDDAIEHYGLCSKWWSFPLGRRPGGMGITTASRCREAFFLLQVGMTSEDQIKMALAIYALYMVVNHCRWQRIGPNFNHRAALRMWVRRAGEGSRAWGYLPSNSNRKNTLDGYGNIC